MTKINHQLKLAYISPLPPAKSGIADYSAMLLPALSQHYEVVVIVDAPVSDAWVNSHLEVRDVAWFKAHASAYDRVIYHIGNSAFHYYMFDLIAQFPGVVVLHDFFLGHAVSGMDALGFRPGLWSQSLYESHGEDALYRWFKQLELEELQWTYPANAMVLRQANGVIVHTHYCKQLADAWYGQDYAAQWSVIPLVRTLPKPYDRASLRRRHQLKQKDFLICSFGMCGPTKLNDRLLAAWLDSELAANPDGYLIFVGEADNGPYGQTLANLIGQSEYADRIKITGWVDDATYQDYLAMADVAVQLRASSRGEMSAAVLDCMRYGLPTIVNAQGGLSEIVEGAVYSLSAEFPQAELVFALNLLGATKKTRQALSTAARLEIERHHLPQDCARQYAEAIESFYGAMADRANQAQVMGNITVPQLPDWALIKQLRQAHHDGEADLYLRMTAHRQLIEDQLEETSSQLNLTEKKLRIAEVKLRQSEVELSVFLASYSWRLTWPMRRFFGGIKNALHWVKTKRMKVKARLKEWMKVILIHLWMWLASKALFVGIKHKMIYRFPVIMHRLKYFLTGTPPRPAEAVCSELLSSSEQTVYERLKLAIQDRKSEGL